jgi:hypothetical protein
VSQLINSIKYKNNNNTNGFFLWGYLKNLGYPSCSLLDLRDKIKQNIQNILPKTLENVKNTWV